MLERLARTDAGMAITKMRDPSPYLKSYPYRNLKPHPYRKNDPSPATA